MRLGRVGIITAVGFVLGVVWPRLAGVKLVPTAPVEGVAEVAGSGEPESEGSESPPPAAAVVPAPAAEPKPNEALSRLKVGKSQVTSCRDGEGKRQIHCDELELEAVLDDKLKMLALCKGTETARGTLSLGLELDLPKKKILEVTRGRSTTLPDDATQAFLDCARKDLSGVALEGVKHTRAQYTVFFVLDVVPTGENVDKPEPKPDEASGRATVGWEVAIIRDTPKDGAIVARILRGTNVVVTGRQNDWYKVKYDAKGNEGWVFRTAIGL
jgi:hypothetical protein